MNYMVRQNCAHGSTPPFSKNAGSAPAQLSKKKMNVNIGIAFSVNIDVNIDIAFSENIDIACDIDTAFSINIDVNISIALVWTLLLFIQY